MVRMSDCLFCKIAAGEIPVKLVAESPSCVAFRDISPQAPTHILVIPRAHIASLDAVSDPTIVAEMATMARQLARDEGIAESGYRIVMNTGDDGGQSVHHLHLHLLGGRAMSWPPG
jgi:histidine triad (HIT) family protein